MEIVKQETNLPAELDGAWGSEGISKEDILIPKILLMQAMSQLVTEKEIAEPGDIIVSTTEEVVGGKENPLIFVPLMSFKTWTISELVGAKYEFRDTIPMTPKNAADPLEFEENGVKYRRDKGLNFYVLLKKDLEAAAKGEGAVMPALLAFRRTSFTAGKKLASGIQMSSMMKKSAASSAYALSSTKRKTDDHTYYVYDVAPSKDSKVSIEELAVAKQWYDTLMSSQVKVDDSSDE